HVISGCFVGTDASGALAKPNVVGVNVVDSNNNTVGGALPGLRNVSSGNSRFGVQFYNTSFPTKNTGNKLLGNYIGTNAAGLIAIQNGVGVQYRSQSNFFIGGTNVGEGNLVSGNQT